MTALVLVTLALAGTGGPAAYPIAPRPLRRLVAEAQFIVTARVVEAEADVQARALERAEFGARSVVVLELERLVKGDPGARSIVQVNHGLGCPAPARYHAGTRVLAFLDRGPDGRFTTHALSYGAKTLGDAGLTLYLQRIEEQFEIERMPEGEARRGAQLEWLVRCAEEAATRWEGAYELAPGGDYMSRYDRKLLATDLTLQLSATQRARLRASFLAARTFGAGERCLEEALREDPDPRLLAWLVKELEAHHREVETQGYGAAAFLVERIGRRDPRPEVRELAASFASMREYGAAGDDGAGRLQAVLRLLAFY